jgi:opacity protein-like surface antigen
MKALIFLLLLTFGPLQSAEWIAELRAGYFYPTSKKFREIYRQGGPEGEVEVSKSFSENWIGWGNINYFQRSGRSKGFHDRTTIRMLPLSLGLKYQFQFCNCFSPYIGAGVTYTFLNVKNAAHFVKRHVSREGFGFVLKSGVNINLSEDFLLDLFLDYYYQDVRFHDKHRVEVGGLRTGIGLGYRF